MSFDYLNFSNYNYSNNNNDTSNISKLVDPKIKNFFNKALRKCHDFKNEHYNFISNIIYFIIFIIILITILLYKYKGNKNSYEKKLEDNKKKEYILAKLIHINKMSNKEKQNSLGLITDLPAINNLVNQNLSYNNFRKEVFNN